MRYYMILDKEIEILITPRNITYYRELGYNDIKFNDKIMVIIEHLPKFCKMNVNVKCEVCEKESQLKYEKYVMNVERCGFYSCKGCSNKKRVIVSQEKWGVDNYSQTEEYKEKVEKTNMEKYGVKTTLLNPETREKIKKTNIERYGTEEVLSSSIIREKSKETFLEKYGVDHYSKSDDFKTNMKETWINKTSEEINKIKEKAIKTNMERYGVTSYTKTEEFLNKCKITNNKNFGADYVLLSKEKRDDIISKKQKTIKNKHENQLGHGYYILEMNGGDYVMTCPKGHTFNIHNKFLNSRIYSKIEVCTICLPVNNKNSYSETMLSDFIKSQMEHNISNVECGNRKILNGKELDIYLPDLNLAFEFNGLYWHSELEKPNDYHLQKTEKCLEKGIQLIHIFEDEWFYKEEIVKSRILNLLGKTPNKIFARKCEIREVSGTESKIFCEQNHIQGEVNAKVKIGLYYNNELVSLMTFGGLRKNLGQSKKEGHYELLRFCNKLNTNVIGAASKLFKHFVKKFNPDEVLSYADRSWSTGGLYTKLGFDFISNTDPNYWYVKNDIRYNRWNFRKDILVKEGYDASKTEHDIMLDRGYYRIYNSGSMKFIWKRK